MAKGYSAVVDSAYSTRLTRRIVPLYGSIMFVSKSEISDRPARMGSNCFAQQSSAHSPSTLFGHRSHCGPASSARSSTNTLSSSEQQDRGVAVCSYTYIPATSRRDRDSSLQLLLTRERALAWVRRLHRGSSSLRISCPRGGCGPGCFL